MTGLTIQERICEQCSETYSPPQIDGVFTRVDPQLCPDCATEMRSGQELRVPIVHHSSSGIRHAVTKRPYNEDGRETCCGLVIKDVPKTGAEADVECGNCSRILDSHDEN